MTTTRGASGDSQLRELVAGQAKSEARFDEVFHRLSKVEEVSGEARDIGREIVATLREQDALAKIAEARADATGQIAALRQDVVKAIDNVRSDVAAAKRAGEQAFAERDSEIFTVKSDVADLKALRDQAKGAAWGGRLLLDGLKIVAGAGGGALLLKLLEHLR